MCTSEEKRALDAALPDFSTVHRMPAPSYHASHIDHRLLEALSMTPGEYRTSTLSVIESALQIVDQADIIDSTKCNAQ